jgi:hypothetical protein
MVWIPKTFFPGRDYLTLHIGDMFTFSQSKFQKDTLTLQLPGIALVKDKNLPLLPFCKVATDYFALIRYRKINIADLPQ